jgi:carbon-monoxide dehydrogenase iron sulfur subunit
MTDDSDVDALLATPLFADVADELLDAVRFEATAGSAGNPWPENAAPRAGFVQFRSYADNQEIVAQGDLTTELIVVLSGQVEAVQARGGRDVHRHRIHVSGTWFGEVSAHSHHPALATWRAMGAVRIAALDARLFTRLYDEDENFAERIDDSYRANLGLHLRASSLCRDLDDLAIRTLQQAAELVTLDPDKRDDDKVLAAAGDPATTFWLVRAGAIACVTEVDGRERVLAYYKGNATFGEHAIVSDRGTWPATFKPLMRTSLVALSKQAFAALPEPARTDLARAANRLIGPSDVDAARNGDDVVPMSMLDELHVMVERESVKGGRALVIDRTKCVRCNMCVESCVDTHADAVPRLSKVGTTVTTDQVLITACYHCELPQCMLSCGYAAIRRDPQGRIRFEYDNCVGCAACIEGCPYGVIRLVEPAPPPPPIQSVLARLPLIGRWFQPPAAPSLPGATAGAAAGGAAGGARPGSVGAGGDVSPVTGKTIKCDLCAGMPFEACVYNCPTTAITRREPQSLFDRRGGR